MMSVYASKRPVEQSHTHIINTFQTHARCCVLCCTYSTGIFNMQERQKQKRQAFFCTKRRGHRQAQGRLAILCIRSLFVLRACRDLLSTSFILSFARMNGCTYTFTVELWPAKNPQQTQDAKHESSLSGCSFPSPPPQTKKTTQSFRGKQRSG